MGHIADVLESIAQLLLTSDYHDKKKIASLKSWAKVLSSDASREEKLKVVATVKSIIAGMNSLSDITLYPPVVSGMSGHEADQKLDAMTKELDRAVRRELGLE